MGFSFVGLATTLAACEEQVKDPNAQDTAVYTSLAQCEKENSVKVCEDAQKAAQGEHTASAPLFASTAECEAQWGAGRCEPGHGSYTHMFVPMMAGFMLAHALNNSGRCGPGTPYSCNDGWGGGHGVYIGNGGRVYAGWNEVGSAKAQPGGGFSMPRSVSVVEGPGGKISPGVTTRGGFGRAFSRFGGGRGG